MSKVIDETVNYLELIKALSAVADKIHHLLDTPCHFAILFGEDSWDEVLITIEYVGLSHEFATNCPVSDLHEVLTEYGTKKFVDGMVKTIMVDSMKEFFNYLNKKY